MRKYLFAFAVMLLAISLAACDTNSPITEAKEFKEDYEKLNGTEAKAGHTHRVVTIDEDNPFVKITGDEIIKKIENKDSFYLYIGDPKCPWCRSIIEVATKKSKEYGIEKFYYLKFWDDDYNEVYRDKYVLDENNEPKLEVKGTDSYMKLLSYSEKLLRDYTLTNSDGYDFMVGEKRIYGPSYFYIDNGVVKLMIEGKSEKQTDKFQELTDEIIADEEANFDEFFIKSMSCDESC